MTHQTFCHYEILEKLGEGGMGIVYRAHDSKLNRLVALKFPSLPPLETGDHVDRFYREARAISALNHPNIATIYDVNEDQGRRFLVLEYLPGGTLRTLLRNWRNAGRKLSLIELLDFALQIADGLAHSHRNGVIHRDIKSDNVMFTAEGALKITDFSMAKCTDGLQLTRTGSVAGTVAYMSPEQAQGLEVDHRSDVFSFGILLYEMATGELPFRGPHEAVVLHDIVHEPTPLVRVLRPDLPETFEAVVQRATAKKPEDRFQKMEELFNALVALREAAGPAGSALRRHTNASMATVALSSRPTLVAKGAPPNRWKKRALTLGAATVLALLLFGVIQWIGGMKFQARMLPEKRQLAVLPFRNIGDDARNQAFIDGLTETLSSKLSQLERFVGPPGQTSLGVVPMSEVRGEKNVTPSEARKRFGVSLVLSGAVQRQGNKVRVSVNLIDTGTMRNLNSYVLDTQIEEIYPLQDGIFYQVAEMLGVPLAPQAQEVLTAGQTANSQALELYLQGLGKLARYDQQENVVFAMNFFQEALQKDANYALAHAALGEAFLRKYNASKEPAYIDQARRSCARALQLNPHSAQAHVTLGLVHTSTGQYEEAIREFDSALQIDPVNAHAFRELARAYEGKGLIKEAEEKFLRAITINPNYWAGYNNLAGFYFRNGRYAEAETYFKKWIALTPDSYHAHRNLAGLYSLMERYEEAIVEARKSIEIKPTYEAYNNLATVYFFQGNYRESARMYEEILKFTESDHVIWGNLGDARRFADGQNSKAAEAYRQAIQLIEERDLNVNPRDAEARSSLAVYAAGLSDSARAIREIEQARLDGPGNVNVLFRAALVYELAKQRPQALQAIASAMQGGYSLAEIQRHPDLTSLRQDPDFVSLQHSLKKSETSTPQNL